MLNLKNVSLKKYEKCVENYVSHVRKNYYLLKNCMRVVIKDVIYWPIYAVVWNLLELKNFYQDTVDVLKRNYEKKNIEEILNAFIPVILKNFLGIKRVILDLQPISIKITVCTFF